MAAEVHPSATVYPGTVLGDGVRVLENAVVGKQPALSSRSTAKREPQPPTEIGEGTIVSTGAIVFAGSRIGARVVLGDQSCVRERVTIGDDVVLGRGSLVENDTTIGEEAFVGAGAVVTKDVPPRVIVVGNPARVLREVPQDELLD
jgi:acetyltransferase-like isoleucine patch superfamily enzyme